MAKGAQRTGPSTPRGCVTGVACLESDALWLDIGRRDDFEAAREAFERERHRFRLAEWPDDGLPLAEPP